VKNAYLRITKEKYKILTVALLLFALVLSAGCNVSQPSGKSAQNGKSTQSAPAYVKSLSEYFAKKGITVEYAPAVTFANMPQPKKPYTLPVKRNIPNNWIIGSLKWYFSGPYCFTKNYILQQDTDDKASVLKLYERKNANGKLPKELTPSDYTLVATLDKAPRSGPMPQNQEGKVSEDFVVWNASSSSACTDWTLWAYDIHTGNTFKVISSADYGSEEPISRFFPDNPGKLCLWHTNEKNGNTESGISVYDLKSRTLLPVVSSSTYQYYGASEYDGVVYANKKKPGDKGPGEVVEVNLSSRSETVLVPDKFNFSIADAVNGKVALIAHPKDGSYDIWILDTKKKTLHCFVHIEKFAESDEYVGVALAANEGFAYYIVGKGRGVHYFYSYKEGRAISTGPIVSNDFYHSGIFLVPKYEYDLFSPIPKFDYPGKAERLKGFWTLLLVKPE